MFDLYNSILFISHSLLVPLPIYILILSSYPAYTQLTDYLFLLFLLIPLLDNLFNGCILTNLQNLPTSNNITINDLLSLFGIKKNTGDTPGFIYKNFKFILEKLFSIFSINYTNSNVNRFIIILHIFFVSLIFLKVYKRKENKENKKQK